MNTRSANLAQMEALWREYVNADPDLRRLEHRKRVIAHRRIWVAHAKKVRREAGRAILQTLGETAGMILTAFLFVCLFYLLIIAA